MFTQKKSLSALFKIGLSLLLFLLLSGPFAQAQIERTFNTNGSSHRVNAFYYPDDYNTYADYTIPDDVAFPYLYLRLEGADGGRRWYDDGATDWTVPGGAGATIRGVVKIGTGLNEISPGSTLRMMIGMKGESVKTHNSRGAKGGGGTGIFVKKAGSDTWHVLAIAGGGGGAYSDCCSDRDPGQEGQTGENGGGSDGGKNGNSGDRVSVAATDGNGKGLWSAWPEGKDDPTIEPVGDGQINTGFGVGNGGKSYYSGGGGGGYSGGELGNTGEQGGGGGSYVHPLLVYYSSKSKNGTTNEPGHGFVDYQFTNSPVNAQTIHSRVDKDYALDIAGGENDNGTDIQLYENQTDKDSVNQQWVFEDFEFQRASDRNKCLDRKSSGEANGTKIQLYECNRSDAQLWIFDGFTRQIRAKKRLDHCIELKDGNTTNRATIHLWDCNQHTRQQWKINGLSYKLPSVNDKSKVIHLAIKQEKCLDLQGGNIANQTNIQLYTCQTGEHKKNQQWIYQFDTNEIKLASNPNYCLDVKAKKTSNGTNIQLYECNNGTNQEWIYDGVTNQIRWRKHLDKCIDLSQGNTADRSNIQLWDCQLGNTNQQWVIE